MTAERKKPLGAPLDLTDDDLDRMAEVTEADEKRAAAKATPGMRALAEAEEAEP